MFGRRQQVPALANSQQSKAVPKAVAKGTATPKPPPAGNAAPTKRGQAPPAKGPAPTPPPKAAPTPPPKAAGAGPTAPFIGRAQAKAASPVQKRSAETVQTVMTPAKAGTMQPPSFVPKRARVISMQPQQPSQKESLPPTTQSSSSQKPSIAVSASTPKEQQNKGEPQSVHNAGVCVHLGHLLRVLISPTVTNNGTRPWLASFLLC